jgi:hypothetical protein
MGYIDDRYLFRHWFESCTPSILARIRAELAQFGVVVGEKTIRGVLKRANLVEHHSRARIKKKEKFYAPFAGYRLQVDTKAVPN